MRGLGRITHLGGTPPPVISALGECSATLTLTVAHQDVAGCSLSLTAGTYIVMGFFAFRGDNTGTYAIGYLDVDGTEQTAQAQWRPAASVASAASVSQVWRITLASTKTVKLRANKNVDVGTFTAQGVYTNILAIRTQE